MKYLIRENSNNNFEIVSDSNHDEIVWPVKVYYSFVHVSLSYGIQIGTTRNHSDDRFEYVMEN